MDRREITCIICPEGCPLVAEIDQKGEISDLTGHKCKRGETYVRSEILNPVRILSSLVRIEGAGTVRMCPVRSSTPVPKELLLEMANLVSKFTVKTPVRVGDVVIKNILGTNSNIVVTRNFD